MDNEEERNSKLILAYPRKPSKILNKVFESDISELVELLDDEKEV